MRTVVVSARVKDGASIAPLVEKNNKWLPVLEKRLAEFK